MKRVFAILMGVCGIVLLASCGGEAEKVDDEAAKEYTEAAKDVISLLNDHEYEKVFDMFDEKMEEGLPLEQMDELTPVIDESGDFKEIKNASVEKKDGFYIAVLAAKYSQNDRIYTITFHKDKQIAGLYIK